jgi:hypothetical protein
MTQVIYPKFKEHLLSVCLGASAKIVSPVVKAILVDAADYTYSASHEFLSDVPSGARVSTSPDLANRTYTAGVLDADDTTFSAVTGDQSEIVLFVVAPAAGANDANTRLVAYEDSSITGAPVTPNSGDINLAFDSGANKIFAL